MKEKHMNKKKHPKKMIFAALLGAGIFCSMYVGIKLVSTMKSKPVEVNTPALHFTIMVPGNFTQTISDDKVEIQESYGRAITIQKEVEDVKTYDFGAKTKYQFGTTVTQNVDELIAKQKAGVKVLSKEEFSNGFGARFENKDGERYFEYISKVGDQSLRCTNNYFDMENESVFINICKSIK